MSIPFSKNKKWIGELFSFESENSKLIPKNLWDRFSDIPVLVYIPFKYKGYFSQAPKAGYYYTSSKVAGRLEEQYLGIRIVSEEGAR